MDNSPVDFPALLLAAALAAGITAVMVIAQRGGSRRRLWSTAAVLAVALLAIGMADLLRESPRETHIATLIVGVPLPVLGAAGMVRASHRVRPWLRWTLVFVTALLLLFLGLLVGATLVPRFLP